MTTSTAIPFPVRIIGVIRVSVNTTDADFVHDECMCAGWCIPSIELVLVITLTACLK